MMISRLLLLVFMAAAASTVSGDMANDWLATPALGTLLESKKPAAKPPPAPAPAPDAAVNSLPAGVVAVLPVPATAGSLPSYIPPSPGAPYGIAVQGAATQSSAGVVPQGGAVAVSPPPGAVVAASGSPYAAAIPNTDTVAVAIPGTGVIAVGRPTVVALSGPTASAPPAPARAPAAAAPAPRKIIAPSMEPFTGEATGGVDPKDDDVVAGPADQGKFVGSIGGGPGFTSNVMPDAPRRGPTGFATPRDGPVAAGAPAPAQAAPDPVLAATTTTATVMTPDYYMLAYPVTAEGMAASVAAAGGVAAPAAAAPATLAAPTLAAPPSPPPPPPDAAAVAANATTADDRCTALVASVQAGGLCGDSGASTVAQNAAALARMPCVMLTGLVARRPTPPDACCARLRDYVTSGCGCNAAAAGLFAGAGMPTTTPAALVRVTQAACGAGSVYDPCSQGTGC